MPTDCSLSTGFSPYIPDINTPFNLQRVKHLYRRMGFGETHSTYINSLNVNPQDLISDLLVAAQNAPITPKPPWGDWAQSDYNDFQTELQSQLLEFVIGFTDDIFQNPVRAKLSLFWQNHFATRFEQYVCPSWLYRYTNIIETHQFGNFKTFVKEIGKTPAMLVFLNGVQNTRFSPNENYARELLELFTLGLDNGYTQNDIVQTARALTGWNGFSELCAPIDFVPAFFDPGIKTIFGQSENYNYDSLHDHLFTERGHLIARFICKKLYNHFISPVTDDHFVQGMADFFIESDFELTPLYEKLFRSERFFDIEIIGNIVKSPVQYFVSFLKETNFEINNELKTILLFQMGALGQTLFNPPTVAGWPIDKDWITTSLLSQRWVIMEAFVYQIFLNESEKLRILIKGLSESNNDPLIITTDFVDFFLSRPLQNPIEYEQLSEFFKWEVPENYYVDKSWNLDWETVPIQTILLLQKIIRTPEFQLT